MSGPVQGLTQTSQCIAIAINDDDDDDDAMAINKQLFILFIYL